MTSSSVTAVVQTILVFGEGAATNRSLDAFVPDDPEHFGVNAQVFIGEAGNGLVDSFDITVCSPSWMAERVAAGQWDRFRHGGLRILPESVAVGTGIWFMRRWDREAFELAVRTTCSAFSPGPDWGTVACRVGRLIPWEFDYKYDAHVNEHFGEPFPPPR
jgi:hypothetical protein